MENESESLKMVAWFNSLSHSERREKVKSLKEFFDRNTGQLIRTMRNLEKVGNCPENIIEGTRQLIANNMKTMSTLEKIEKGIDDAEKEVNSQATEGGTTASTE